MMRRTLLLSLALFGCKGDKDDTSGTTPDDTGPTEEDTGPSPSGFESGQYRITSLEINEPGDGIDWNDDGKSDNKLPTVLNSFDAALSDLAISRDVLNKQIAKDITANELVFLKEAEQLDGELTIDLFPGLWDEKKKAYTIDDENAYDGGGEPLSHLVGAFETDTEFAVGPANVLVSIPILEKEPPTPFPVEEVTIGGTLTDTGSAGTMWGIVPVNRFVDEVLVEIVPKEGYGDRSKKDIIELAELLLNSSADAQTVDKRPAITAAFTLSSEAETF